MPRTYLTEAKAYLDSRVGKGKSRGEATLTLKQFFIRALGRH